MAGDAGPCYGFSNWDFDGPVGWSNSNYEVKAPGVGVNSTIPGGNYKKYSGTSMASPIVAGAVALMRQNKPDDSGEQVFAKILQSSGNFIDVDSCLKIILKPDLHFVEYTIVDTLPGCDRDGVADAGEMIELVITVKNVGGQADSVSVKLDFGEYEDHTVAEIIDSTSLIGSMSVYSTLKGQSDAIKIKINNNVADSRDIVFKYFIESKNGNVVTGNLTFTIQNGIELNGYISGLKVLSANKYYIITDNVVIDSLIIKPGTTLRFEPNAVLKTINYLSCDGKPDSLITFTWNGNGRWANIDATVSGGTLSYCLLEYANISYDLVKGASLVENCIFKYIGGSGDLFSGINVKKCVIIGNTTGNICWFAPGVFQYNIVTNNETGYYAPLPLSNLICDNVAFNNSQRITGTKYSFTSAMSSWGVFQLPSNYLGSSDSTTIGNDIEDFFENAGCPIVLSDSIMKIPPKLCHGIVWKIEINNIHINKYDNPYNSETGLGIIGDETLKFDVYFNRAMDTTYTPLLTFGVREPYTQHIVGENGSWSADSTIYTAFYTVTAKTGDGIQRVRVASARDDEYFEIPIEDSRFEFVIQAAGAVSLAFQATPGIGKVDLEWPAATTYDALGYNIYRITNLTDSTTSDTFLISTELIIETLYLDTEVEPGTTYQYLYKTVGTDMQETDFSKAVAATPFSAADGDANGDQSVNVSDIVTVVNYILENNPAPFLFDAADVNYDDAINVLDIVALVNIILGPQETAKAAFAGTAQISIENGIVYVDSPIALGGIQFTLADVSAEQEVEILEALEGFEVVRKMKDGKLTILAYSLSGNTINEGKTALLKLTNTSSWIFEAILSNTTGQSIDFEMKDAVTGLETMKLNAGFSLGQNYPNPFTSITTIPFELDMEVEEANLTIYDLLGRTVKTWQLNKLNKGKHEVEWNGEERRGVFMYQMTIKQKGLQSYTKTKRMVIN
jgi:hypothetical protein